MTALTVPQEAQLKRLQVAQSGYRLAKNSALERARALVGEEVREHQMAVDHEVRIALTMQIPKRAIYRIGLGTSDAATLERSLQRTASVAATVDEIAEIAPPSRYAPSDKEPENPALADKPAIKITMHGEDWDQFIAGARKRLRKPEYANATEAVVFWLGGPLFGHEYDHSGSAGWAIDHPVIGFHKERWSEVAEAARALGLVEPLAEAPPARRAFTLDEE